MALSGKSSKPPAPTIRIYCREGGRRSRVEPAAEIYDAGEFTVPGSRHVKCAWEGVNGDSIEWRGAIRWKMAHVV